MFPSYVVTAEKLKPDNQGMTALPVVAFLDRDKAYEHANQLAAKPEIYSVVVTLKEPQYVFKSSEVIKRGYTESSMEL